MDSYEAVAKSLCGFDSVSLWPFLFSGVYFVFFVGVFVSGCALSSLQCMPSLDPFSCGMFGS